MAGHLQKMAFTALLCAGIVPPLHAEAKPSFDDHGTVHVPAFDLPPSELASPEARAAQAMRARVPGGVPAITLDIKQIRQGLEHMLAPQVAAMRKQFPVNVREQQIGGVPTRIFTPQRRSADPSRILINLHGGGFAICADACSMLESAPIASVGGLEVVSVNYRMGPEAQHPAALEDLTNVYRTLLKRYRPSQIGIYGCSAGGALSGEAPAWLPRQGLPEPGAIGIFGAGALRFGAGDSTTVAAYIDGSFPPPPKPGEQAPDPAHGYFATADMADEIISPALHPKELAKFPPTLLITGTRAMDMSAAIVTNSRLLKAGVSSTLIVGEGMGHCYMYQSQLPEAQDAYAAIVSFFRKNLH